MSSQSSSSVCRKRWSEVSRLGSEKKKREWIGDEVGVV